jgi:flavodoxin
MKKILLLYYSGSGNTKFIAAIIEQLLVEKGHVVQSARIIEKNICSLENDFDVLFLGFPTYFRDAPELVYKALDTLPGNNRPIMTFMSRGLYSGNTFKNVHKKALEKRFAPIGFINLFMPGPDLLTSAIKENSFLEKFLTNIYSRNMYKKIKKFIDKMNKGDEIKDVKAKWYTIIDEWIVKKAEIKVNNAYKDWIEKFWANKEKCNQCMKCINGCPRSNIQFNKEIVFGRNCDVCLYCIGNCPQKAINISQKTVGNVKYSEDKIKEIMAKEMNKATYG